LLKNENQGGKFIVPFKCDKTIIKRIDKHDTYKTEKCIVKHGVGGPVIELLTGNGKIKVITN